MRGDSKAAMAGGRGNVPGWRVLLPFVLTALLLLVQSPAAEAQSTSFQEFGSPVSAPSSSPFSPPLPPRSSQTGVSSPGAVASPPPPPPSPPTPQATPAAAAAPVRSPPPPPSAPVARSPPPPSTTPAATTTVEAPTSSVNSTTATGGSTPGVSTPGTTTGTPNPSPPPAPTPTPPQQIQSPPPQQLPSPPPQQLVSPPPQQIQSPPPQSPSPPLPTPPEPPPVTPPSTQSPPPAAAPRASPNPPPPGGQQSVVSIPGVLSAPGTVATQNPPPARSAPAPTLGGSSLSVPGTTPSTPGITPSTPGTTPSPPGTPPSQPVSPVPVSPVPVSPVQPPVQPPESIVATPTGTSSISTPGITTTNRTVPSPAQAPASTTAAANTTSPPPPPQPAAPAPTRTQTQTPPPPTQQARAAAPVQGLATPGVTASPPPSAPAPESTPTPPAPAPSAVVVNPITPSPSSSRRTPTETTAAPAPAAVALAARSAATTPAAAAPRLELQPVAVSAPGPGEVFEAPVRGVVSAAPLPTFSAASLGPAPAPMSSAAATPENAAPAPSTRAVSSPAPAVVLPQLAPAPLPRAASVDSGAAATPTPAPAPSNGTIAPAAIPTMAPVPAPAAEVPTPNASFSRAPTPQPSISIAMAAPAPSPQIPDPQGDVAGFSTAAPAPAPELVPEPVAAPQIAPVPAPAPDAPQNASAPAPVPQDGVAGFYAAAPAPAPEPMPEPVAAPRIAPVPAPEPVATQNASAPAPVPPPVALTRAPEPVSMAPAPVPAPVLLVPSPAVNFTALAPSPLAPEPAVMGPVPAPNPSPGSGTLLPTVTPAQAPAPVPAVAAVSNKIQVPAQVPAADTPAPAPAPGAAGLGVGVLVPGGAPSPSPADGAVGAFSVQAPAPGPGGVGSGAPSPAPATTTTTTAQLATVALANNAVGYAPSALAPDLESNLQFSPGPVAAAAPGVPDWLVGTQQIGTNLFYVGDGQNQGFYTVQTENGTANVDSAFATVPSGSNVSSYSQLGIQTLLQGSMLFPFNETYQAALLNQLHIAFDQASVPHILQYQSATDLGNSQSSTPATGSTGRKLAQTNADNITNAVVSVTSQQDVQVNLTVAVPYEDRNNVSAIVNDAISSGQIRRGLQEAGLQVQNASVTAVNTIISGTNPNLTPTPTSGTPSPSSGGSSVNGAVIGGAVGGGVAALAILGLIAWKVHSNRSKKKLEMQASAAQKMEPSNAMAHVYTNNGRPGYIKTGVRKGSGDGALLTNGYSTTSSPIANSVQPLSAHSGHSDPYQALLSVPDTPDWRPYRQFVGMGQQNYLNHIPGTEHLLDANVPQVIKSDLKMAKEIGKGSFGKVSIANWRGTTVAVKELKGNEEQGISPTAPEVLKALQKEASMMAAMRHPNVVLFLGICIESPSLITEYCARNSLYEVIQQWTRGKEVANWLRRLGMVLDAAKGMQYLHSCSPPIIHRDLKSPNLLVDKNYNVKICDFNLSKVMECTNSNVTSSLISVNPRWLAPEILKETGYSKASDVYSFGIVMWEMMTWQVPWKDLTTWQIMGMMSNRDNIPRPDIPDRLDCLPGGTFDGMADYVDLMRLCWAEEPAERPDFPKVASTLRHIMGREASLRRERSNRRNSSLGTDHASSAGLFSVGTQAATTDNDSSSDHSPHAHPPKSGGSSAEASD